MVGAVGMRWKFEEHGFELRQLPLLYKLTVDLASKKSIRKEKRCQLATFPRWVVFNCFAGNAMQLAINDKQALSGRVLGKKSTQILEIRHPLGQRLVIPVPPGGGFNGLGDRPRKTLA